MAKKKQTYENAMNELEVIINDLEQGNISLKDLVSKYSKGMELLAYCHEELTNAEQEMNKVVFLNDKNKVVEEKLELEGE